MNETIREQLSAFIDGELSPSEAELFVKRLERDPALGAALDRYMMAGAAIRTQTAVGPSTDFAARVAIAIADEKSGARPAWASRWRRKPSRWTRPLVGGVAAAGVFALSMLLFPQWSNRDVAVTPTVAASAPTSAGQPVVIPAEVVRASQLRQQMELYSNGLAPQVQQGGRLATYVMAHSQFSSPLNRRNVLTGLLVEDADDPTATTEVAAERAAEMQ